MIVGRTPQDHRLSCRLPSGHDPVLVRLRLIGQMEAWTLTSESILPDRTKTRALLAIVALSAPRPVLRGKLAELLWSRRPEEQARASLAPGDPPPARSARRCRQPDPQHQPRPAGAAARNRLGRCRRGVARFPAQARGAGAARRRAAGRIWTGSTRASTTGWPPSASGWPTEPGNSPRRSCASRASRRQSFRQRSNCWRSIAPMRAPGGR